MNLIPTQEIDTHGFTLFLQDLARIAGKDFKEVLVDQAGAVLEICIKRSPNPWKSGEGRADVKKKVALRIQKPGRYIGDGGSLVAENRVPRPVPTATLQTNTGTRGGEAGREWYVGRNRVGKRIYLPPDRMLGNEKFHRRQGIKFALYADAEPKVQEAVGAIGSVAASWVHLADKIGAPLRKAPKWIFKVRGRFNDGERSRVEISDARAFVELVNTNSMLIAKYNGAAILQGAIDTRLKAFEHEIRNGVFEDLAFRAKRYPGLFTSP
jgi:hypothetical protein